MKNAPAVIEAKPPAPIDFVDLDRARNPVNTLRNTINAIQMLGFDCRYNAFTDRYTIEGTAFGNDILQVSDPVARKLRVLIRDEFRFEPSISNAIDALYYCCEANRYHPVLDYLSSNRWDGKPRIDAMFSSYFGAEDSEFNRGVARLMMVASVRRILQPGCKFDCVAVLQSPEGRGKSSALAALYGEENFSDQGVLGASDKDLAEALRGRWCVEVPELVGLKRSEIEKVKAAITRQTDRVRPAYGRAVVDAPRTMVFWGTTNDEEYLRALSGENRRFLPVTVGRIDVEGLKRDRDQLWAEAFAEEQFDGSLSLPEELWKIASEERAKRTQNHPWIDELENVSAVAAAAQRAVVDPDDEEPAPAQAIYDDSQVDALGNPEERVASRFILESMLQIPIERRTADHAKTAGLAMRANGWQGPKGLRVNGANVKGFVRPIAQPWD